MLNSITSAKKYKATGYDDLAKKKMIKNAVYYQGWKFYLHSKYRYLLLNRFTWLWFIHPTMTSVKRNRSNSFVYITYVKSEIKLVTPLFPSQNRKAFWELLVQNPSRSPAIAFWKQQSVQLKDIYLSNILNIVTSYTCILQQFQ